MPQPRRSPAALVTRTVLWILLASVFLFSATLHLLQAHAAGQRPSPWLYGQLVVWSLALVFWLYTGWRDWTKRSN